MSIEECLIHLQRCTTPPGIIIHENGAWEVGFEPPFEIELLPTYFPALEDNTRTTKGWYEEEGNDPEETEEEDNDTEIVFLPSDNGVEDSVPSKRCSMM